MKYFNQQTIRYFLFVVVFLLQTSCTNISNVTYQKVCEQKFTKFSRVVTCLNQSARANPHYRFGINQDYEKYIAYANELAKEVGDKKISEKQAHSSLSAAYIKLNEKNKPTRNKYFEYYNNRPYPVEMNSQSYFNFTNDDTGERTPK